MDDDLTPCVCSTNRPDSITSSQRAQEGLTKALDLASEPDSAEAQLEVTSSVSAKDWLRGTLPLSVAGVPARTWVAGAHRIDW
jgi:hypothetical protein